MTHQSPVYLLGLPLYNINLGSRVYTLQGQIQAKQFYIQHGNIGKTLEQNNKIHTRQEVI